jgi:hypothetical protein
MKSRFARTTHAFQTSEFATQQQKIEIRNGQARFRDPLAASATVIGCADW